MTRQHDAFDAVLDEMRSVYMAKNAAYGPKPIQRTGAVGVLHRIIDKTERLAVLMGDTATDDNGESIEDTLLDLANYAVVMMIVRRGEWGK